MMSDFRIEKPLSLKKVKVSGIFKVGEFNRSKSVNRFNIRPISEERFNKLMIKASKKGLTYIRGTEWAERL